MKVIPNTIYNKIKELCQNYVDVDSYDSIKLRVDLEKYKNFFPITIIVPNRLKKLWIKNRDGNVEFFIQLNDNDFKNINVTIKHEDIF